MAPKAVKSTNQPSVFLPKNETMIDKNITKKMQYFVLANFWDRILSSAIVESKFMMARYATIMPVKMAASAVMPMTNRPKVPMVFLAA